MKWGLGKQLIAGYLPVVLVVSALGATTYREFDHLDQIGDKQANASNRVTQVMALSLELKELQGVPLHYMGSSEEAYRTQFQATESTVLELWDRLAAAAPSEAERAAWDEAGEDLQHLVHAGYATFDGAGHETHDMMGDLDAAIEALEADMTRLREFAERDMAQATQDMQALQGRVKAVLLSAVLLVAILAVATSLILSRRISTALLSIVHSAQRLAGGDLTLQQLAVTRADEVGEMTVAFNDMVRSLRQLLHQVTLSAETVTGAAGQLSGAMAQVHDIAGEVQRQTEVVGEGAARGRDAVVTAEAQMQQLRAEIQAIAGGAQEQAANAEELAALAETMAAAVERVASRAAQLGAVAGSTAKAAGDGAQLVTQTVSSIEEIHESVQRAATKMTALSQKTEQIGAVSAAIAAIADQTNLLALNAAIEAARAGEQGRGFAVVAGEVRRLAERAGRSAGEIADLVRAIQQETSAVMAAMAQETATVTRGTTLAHQAGQALVDIHAMVQQTTADIDQMSEAAAQLSDSAQEVAAAVELAAANAQRNSGAAEEMTRGSVVVQQAMETVGGISVATAAATGEVGLSVAALASAQQEIGRAVNGLSETAGYLQQQLERFTVS